MSKVEPQKTTMERIEFTQQSSWPDIAKSCDLSLPRGDEMNCAVGAYYEISPEERDAFADAASKCQAMCLEAAEHVIAKDRFDEFEIPKPHRDFIRESLRSSAPNLMGRFDFTIGTDGLPKLLEYNADTPALLVEAGPFQRIWREREFPRRSEWNTLEAALTTHIKNTCNGTVHFSCVQGLAYDRLHVDYLAKLTETAGLRTKHCPIEELNWSEEQSTFLDLDGDPINSLYKFYPWEWFFAEDKEACLPEAKLRWYEPPWTLLLGCKAILPVLWELFPDHPNLLPSYFAPDKLGESYAKKPVHAGRGAGISLVKEGKAFSSPEKGDSERFVYQELTVLPRFKRQYASIGIWMVAGEPVALGIRETRQPITDGDSVFVPHLISSSEDE